MKKIPILDNEFGLFSVENYGDVVALRFKESLLKHLVDLKSRDVILDCFDRIANNNTIRVVLLFGFNEEKDRQEYKSFFRKAVISEVEHTSIHRMCNFVNRLVVALVNLNQIVVHANCGEVIPLGLNLSLACDYRIIADSTVLYNPYLEMGMIPKGGGIFFLEKKLGMAKAREFLLFKTKISAREALDLGIVDEVVPLGELQEEALRVAQRFAATPLNTSSRIKRMLNYSLKDIGRYLEIESDEFMRAALAPRLWNN